MANDLVVSRQFAGVKQARLITVRGRIAEIARAENTRIMMTDPRPSSVVRVVDGVIGALEEAARRKIVYTYRRLDQVIAFALETLRERSPVASGRYRDSWFVMIDGSRTDDYSSATRESSIIVTNDQPYSRKINVGHMKLSVPAGVVETAQQIVNAKYGAQVSIRVQFISLPGGYDTAKRGPMTYPSLIIKGR